jgi:hypothetical protein
MPYSEELAEIKNTLQKIEKTQQELIGIMMLICLVILIRVIKQQPNNLLEL